MKLEQAIREYWAGCAALESVLSVDRLTTGRTSDDALPYATLEVRSVRPGLPTNQGPALTEAAFRVVVWHDAYAAAKTIAGHVVEAIDGSSLALPESNDVARIRRLGESTRQHADGRWQWSVDFVASVCAVV